MKVAIIPARGGSKRIPGKNIKDFFGKPVIAYSIEAAMASGCFDKIIVSTDDEQIASVAKAYGAEVPFMRPSDIADDFATTGQVIKHAVQWCQHQGVELDLVCCIYACSPFIAPTKIREAMALLLANPDAYFCFPVCEFAFPIQRAIGIDNDGRATMFQPECFPMRSQDLPAAYHDVGQFYWGRPIGYLTETPMFSSYAIPMPISRRDVVDIDTEDDWRYAMQLFQLKALAASESV